MIRGYNEAVKVLKKYGIWDAVPKSVRTYLEKADPQYGPLRPEELANKPHYHFRVMGPEYMLEAAKKKAEDMGINVTILASSLSDIEARSVGETFAYIANEIEVYGRPLQPPAMFICGGEVIVSVGGKKGVGGRNQELVLSSAIRIAGSKNIVIASADSDGTDGPTDAAGGIVDGYTIERANEKNINVLEELEEHNSYNVLSKLDDLIFTGARGTNVQDLRIVYVGGRTKISHIGLPDYLRTLIQK
jgi:glycerate 2-kinase